MSDKIFKLVFGGPDIIVTVPRNCSEERKVRMILEAACEYRRKYSGSHFTVKVVYDDSPNDPSSDSPGMAH